MADFFIGASVVDGFIAVITFLYVWIGSNDFFGWAGCWVTEYFLNLSILKPIMKKKVWY